MYQMKGVQQEYIDKSQDGTGDAEQDKRTAGQITGDQLQTLCASSGND